ncbi:snapalysin family zinc-dependent metalloprotease [Companilactobacillus mishanensis]|uniref:snapalysin family zinc-dependent metalloprotease n=1 Tax=Companilactobacillus mishanensis TaxID=2486008 RepID=UPI001296BB87|nr:snapalysin family zinc-dependent metalloprotease [Companilactobacillus mishanensis]MQS89846.1 snapalysin family zinc-dependent metalloprotease [Companilactobacillus mishanensis]
MMRKFSLKKIILSAAVTMAVLGTGITATTTLENTASAANNIESGVISDSATNAGLPKNVHYSDNPTFAKLKDATHINIYIDPNLTDAEVKAVLAATQSWSYAAQKLNFYITTDPNQAQIRYLTGKSPNGTAGQTNFETQNGYILNSDIRLNLTQPNEYNDVMVRTLIHETGHALGLDDNYDMPTTSVMYGVANAESIGSGITPKMYDINNIDSLYGF